VHSLRHAGHGGAVHGLLAVPALLRPRLGHEAMTLYEESSSLHSAARLFMPSFARRPHTERRLCACRPQPIGLIP
jgi:hypothetical protein